MRSGGSPCDGLTTVFKFRQHITPEGKVLTSPPASPQLDHTKEFFGTPALKSGSETNPVGWQETPYESKEEWEKAQSRAEQEGEKED